MIFNFRIKRKNSFKLSSESGVKSGIYPAPLLRFKSGAGFTLIELLVVIAIIGILAGLLIVGISSARQKAKNVRAIQEFNQIGLAMQMYYDNNGDWPNKMGDGMYTFVPDPFATPPRLAPDFVIDGTFPTWDASWYCDGCTYYFQITDSPGCGIISIQDSQMNFLISKFALCITDECTSCGDVF